MCLAELERPAGRAPTLRTKRQERPSSGHTIQRCQVQGWADGHGAPMSVR